MLIGIKVSTKSTQTEQKENRQQPSEQKENRQQPSSLQHTQTNTTKTPSLTTKIQRLQHCQCCQPRPQRSTTLGAKTALYSKRWQHKYSNTQTSLIAFF
jgi:hypothetical protein